MVNKATFVGLKGTIVPIAHPGSAPALRYVFLQFACEQWGEWKARYPVENGCRRPNRRQRR